MECELAMVGAIRDRREATEDDQPSAADDPLRAALSSLAGGASIAEAWEVANRCGTSTTPRSRMGNNDGKHR